MVAVWWVVAGVFGLAIGSFLNVVIYRVPAGLSVVSPPSRCPVCEHQIRERHNIPVVGWLLLRGRCYDCRAPISPRYPLVEAATGVAWAAVTAALATSEQKRLLPAALLAVTAVIAFGMMLVDGHRPPARWFVPAVVLAVVLTAVGAAV